MFAANVGTVDRVLRVLVGLALLVWFFADPAQGFWSYAKLIGIIPLATGIFGTCPIYAILGVSTCSIKGN